MKDGKPNAYPPIKGLSASTINHALVTLREMLSHAAFSGLIPSNPAEKVHRLAERHKARGILSFPEVKKLLAEATINEVWSGNQVHYAINLLAASTGMRVGEIRGLQRQHVHLEVEPWIEVAHGWRGKYGLGDPKCLSFREIPLTTMVAKWMGIVMARSPYQAPDALVFFGDVERRRKRGLVPTDGLTPITHKWIQKKFYEALSKIDIDAASRGIVFHSWRHWFVSAIRSSQSLPDHLLRRLSGHKSNAIEAYTHVSRQEFAPVAEVFGKVME
jgi:integrase